METSELKAEVHRSCEGCGRYSIHPDGKNIPVMPQPCNGCYPWDDTDHIRSAWIPADLDAEPPKPTAEPDAMAIIKQALTDYADVFVDLIVERLKDAPPQPAQMICNHAEPRAPNDISKGVWFKSEGSDQWCKGRFVGQVSAVMADGAMFVTVEHNRRLAHNHEDVVRWLDEWSRAYKNGLRSISELNLIIKEANRQCKGEKE